MFLGCILRLLFEPCSFFDVMYPSCGYYVTEFHNKEYVVCESDVVAFYLLNHAI